MRTYQTVIDEINVGRIPDWDSPEWLLEQRPLWTVAHEAIDLGIIFPLDWPHLTLKTDDDVSLAAAMVHSGYPKDKDGNKLFEYPLDSPLLKLADKDGWTVAHHLAANGEVFPEDSPLIFLADKDNETVAHVMANEGYRFSLDSPALKLIDNNKSSVAHCMALRGFIFPKGHEVLNLIDGDGDSVEDLMNDSDINDLIETFTSSLEYAVKQRKFICQTSYANELGGIYTCGLSQLVPGVELFMQANLPLEQQQMIVTETGARLIEGVSPDTVIDINTMTCNDTVVKVQLVDTPLKDLTGMAAGWKIFPEAIAAPTKVYVIYVSDDKGLLPTDKGYNKDLIQYRAT